MHRLRRLRPCLPAKKRSCCACILFLYSSRRSATNFFHMKHIVLWRRLFQIAVIVVLGLLPWLNEWGIDYIKGNLFALDIFKIPFADPATAAQTALGGMAEDALPKSAYYTGAFLSLLIAFFLGRVFCGWICPYGFFSDLFHCLRVRENKAYSPKVRTIQWWCKFTLLLAIFLICALSLFPLLALFSMPGELSLLPLLFWTGISVSFAVAVIVIPLVALIIEVIVKRRFWCELVCPQSIMLGFASWALPKWLAGMRIKWKPDLCDCGKNSSCQKACPVNLNPRHKSGPPRRDCLMCMACVDACQKCGKALQIGFSREK